MSPPLNAWPFFALSFSFTTQRVNVSSMTAARSRLLKRTLGGEGTVPRWAFFWFAMTVACAAGVASAGSARADAPPSYFAKSYALLIGNDEYGGGWRQLVVAAVAIRRHPLGRRAHGVLVKRAGYARTGPVGVTRLPRIVHAAQPA